MPAKLAPIAPQSCPKGYDRDLDKAVSPEKTIAIALQRLKRLGESGDAIFAGTRRVDTGRLGIPVYLGMCGPYARSIMPTRKQMGKGSSPAQAEASAIMEFMERFAFFSFWDRLESDDAMAVRATWSEAEVKFGDALLPVSEMIRSVQESVTERQAREILDLRQWLFYPATNLATGKIVWLPVDWFRLLGEFNGSSAGNAQEESLLQGLAELMERHVCAIVDEKRPITPTIELTATDDPVLLHLAGAFEREGIRLILKDFSFGMPMPTVGALAWDPSTFPAASEIVFTAGTASSPAKAAIRAVTEVAQLAGDFCSRSRYEASGLPKFTDLAQCQWLLEGPRALLNSLPSCENPDICQELMAAVRQLAPINVYAIETTYPDLGVPAHWIVAPGLKFRERDKNQSLGLFTGRKLVEEDELETAETGLATLARLYPGVHFTPFFQGMLALRQGDAHEAARLFIEAAPRQPDPDSRALAEFYAGHALGQANEWGDALPHLEQALADAPAMKEAANLAGVACFKLENYGRAEEFFDMALAIDKGSAMDLANRGVARKLLGKRAEAAKDLAAALELEPNLEFAARHLAELG